MSNYTEDEYRDALVFLGCVNAQFSEETLSVSFYAGRHVPIVGDIDKLRARRVEQCQKMFPHNTLIEDLRSKIDALKPFVPVDIGTK